VGTRYSQEVKATGDDFRRCHDAIKPFFRVSVFQTTILGTLSLACVLYNNYSRKLTILIFEVKNVFTENRMNISNIPRLNDLSMLDTLIEKYNSIQLYLAIMSNDFNGTRRP